MRGADEDAVDRRARLLGLLAALDARDEDATLWTVGGRRIAPDDLAALAMMTPEDAQAVHDALCVEHSGCCRDA